MRFVVGVKVAAEGLALGVEDDGDIAVWVAFDEAADHIDHAFYGAGWLLLAVDQWRQGVERTKQIRRAIDED